MDRYVRSPQTLALLRAVLQALIFGRGEPLVRVDTLEVSQSSWRPKKVHQDWPDVGSQKATIEATLSSLSSTSLICLHGLAPGFQHARQLDLAFSNGMKRVLLLDHGLGAFRAKGKQNHDFGTSPAEQAVKLECPSWLVFAFDDPTRIVVTEP